MSTATRPDINVDCEPGSYADKARAYVARQLRRGSLTQEQADYYVEHAILKDDFAARYRVREYKLSSHNIARLFRSAGANNEQASPIFRDRDYRGRWCHHSIKGDFCAAFDHRDLWGRDSMPLMLVGHPYGDRAKHQAIYDAIAALGLNVEISGKSYYGYGTYQVIVHGARRS